MRAQAAARRFRFAVALFDLDDLVDHRAVENVGNEPCPDPLDLCAAKLLSAGKNRTFLRFSTAITRSDGFARLQTPPGPTPVMVPPVADGPADESNRWLPPGNRSRFPRPWCAGDEFRGWRGS